MWEFAANVFGICNVEKHTKFFCGLVKRNALRGTIKTFDDGKEITTPSEVCLTFQKIIAKSISDIEMLSSDIHLPTISDKNYTLCEAELIENNLVALKSMPNNKTPGNDGLPKELFGKILKMFL